MNEREINYMFTPLDTVDLKALMVISEELKGSKNKKKQSVGVFLKRVIAYRSKDGLKTKKTGGSSISNNHPLSDLKDLQDF